MHMMITAFLSCIFCSSDVVLRRWGMINDWRRFLKLDILNVMGSRKEGSINMKQLASERASVFGVWDFDRWNHHLN